jgi:hypothetical protein
MAEVTINWPGTSGKTYLYYIIPMGTSLQAKPGNYIFSRETKPGTWTPIYIGQTENLDIRFDNHHKASCITRGGVTHIHQHLSGDEKSRLAEESDLVQKWKPPCNG